MASDRSNGWEAIAESFVAGARKSTVGVTRIETWVQSLPAGSLVLELGCGPGGPRSEPLLEAGFAHYAIDASPTLADAYRRRFPQVEVACEAAEESSFFGRKFDGVLAWGLLFLLPEDVQRTVIRRVAQALSPGGRFLFTSPAQSCTWTDVSTGRPSWSLGADVYREELHAVGLVLLAEYDDEGENHYYDTGRLR